MNGFSWPKNIIDQTFLGNSVAVWLWAVGAAALVFVMLKMVRLVVRRRLRDVAAKTKTQVDDCILVLLDHTKSFFLIVIAINVGAMFLALPNALVLFINHASVILVLAQMGMWLGQTVRFAVAHYTQISLTNDPDRATTLASVGLLARILIWIVMVLLALDNLGIDVNALIAGLGIGGIAVALATQNIIGDIFASISIVLDKPFVLGDYIVIGEYMGTIEHIGLKTTRLRSLTGEQIVFNNSDLLKSRIRNYKRMFERRAEFTLGVVYQTSKEKVARIPAMIRAIVESRTQVRFERSHFKQFGNFSLDFETVYYVLNPDHKVYMEIQQEINLAIMEQFAREGIEFAYPTQVVIVQRDGA